MQYRIAVYAEELGQWVQVGPVFSNLEEAVQFLDTFATPFKRLVQLDEPVVQAAESEQTANLDPKRLEFVRYLIRTGRLNEQVDTPIREAIAA